MQTRSRSVGRWPVARRSDGGAPWTRRPDPLFGSNPPTHGGVVSGPSGDERLIEAVELGEVLVGEFDGTEVEVGLDSRWSHRLGDDHDVTLEGPTEELPVAGNIARVGRSRPERNSPSVGGGEGLRPRVCA
jgi:hypothetical protein